MNYSLLFAVTLSLSRYFAPLLPPANAALVNRTIDDADNIFSYLPMANWQAPNNMSCSACLPVPDYQDAYNSTLHYAIHSIPRQDADDLHPSSQQSQTGGEAPVSAPASSTQLSSAASSSVSSSPTPSPAVTSPAPISSPLTQSLQQAAASPTPTSDSHGGGSKGGKDGGGDGGISSRGLSIFRRTDADDPNFKDINITATLSFTGTACYVYCAVPVQSTNTSILSLTNLTFFIDGLVVGQYHHDPSKDTGSTLGYQYQVMVFSKDDLPYGPHVLVIKPALGSVLMLDFVQYTTLDTASTTDSSESIAQATPSGQINSNDSENYSKKNTATFGAALGSTLGVLAVISLAVFISICRRRRRSAKREKRREALESALRPDSPEMRGPQPFIPRYFPGVAPPRDSSSPPPFSSLSATTSRSSEIGPSHGLEFPPAPEHVNAPPYDRVPLVLAEPISRVPISLPPVTRSVSNGDLELPRYQDVRETQLVSIPVTIPMTIPASIRPPSLPSSLEEPTPSSSSRPSSGGTLCSSLLLFPDRPDSYRVGSEAGNRTISPIHVNPDRRPG